MRVIIVIPEEALVGLKIPINRDPERRLRIRLALRLYERGLALFGVVRGI